MLYSVSDGWDPYASRHATRFGISLLVMIVLGFLPMRAWSSMAYPAYFVSLLLLVAVEVKGTTAMGATRWIDIGPARIQPSEIMKLALVLALARYYHGLTLDRVSGFFTLLPPLFLVGAPAALIVKQPDLGTAVLVAATGVTLIFLSGIQWRWILRGAIVGLAGVVALFFFGLQDYQRARILTFLNPDTDQLGAGYHILQSKIAIGSGGVWGKGFAEGTQTQLNFLPEKHTDFIFTVIGEEFGFVGSVGVLALVCAILLVCIYIALSAKAHFGRLAALGASATFAFYVVINTAMVMGLIPVVGVPFPLVSYGGTVMMAVMAGFGLVLNVHIHREDELPRP
jgi:rod shape determining protein RodA